jgi:hypothetical protein
MSNIEWKQVLWLQTATQYYVTVRFAAFAWFIPVTGNLFHHAIEMYLKGHLSATMTDKELRDNLGHDLTKIWRRFKQSLSDTMLDQLIRLSQS